MAAGGALQRRLKPSLAFACVTAAVNLACWKLALPLDQAQPIADGLLPQSWPQKKKPRRSFNSVAAANCLALECGECVRPALPVI